MGALIIRSSTTTTHTSETKEGIPPSIVFVEVWMVDRIRKRKKNSVCVSCVCVYFVGFY